MSTVIENQIVQMSFDNKEFEKNISASMKSLDEFKDEMEFKDSERSFKDLEKASESVDFDKLNKAIDGVGDHFTLVGRVFYKVTDEIADYFTSKLTSAVNAVKSVTTDIIDPKLGYNKYDEYTHGVKSILAALSDEELAKLEANGAAAIDGVEEKLSELMLYTDETSYNFTDMVGTIGKFLGAGISLDSAVADMQGIANWAALSGQNATTASQAMYQMSQALGAGYVKYQDWAQMANLKSMGTTAAKDTFIQAAKEIGTITDEEIAEARRLLGGEKATDAQIRNWFFEADQLNKENARWFTTEVLEAGLKKFSAVSDEVIALSNETGVVVTDFLRAGKRIKKGQSDVAAEMAKFAATGEYEEAELKRIEEVMQRVTSEEYKLGWNALLAAQEAVTFSEAIDATKDAVGTAWMMIFRDLIGTYEEAAELWTDLSNNLYDTFAQPLRDAEEDIAEWAKRTVKVFDETGKEMEITMRQYMWQGFSRIFAGFGAIFSNLFESLVEWGILPSITDALSAVVNGCHSFADVLESIANSKTVMALGQLLANTVNLIKIVASAIGKLISTFFGVSSATESADYSIASVIFILDTLVVTIGDVINWLVSSKGFTWALNIVSFAAGILLNIIRIVTSALGVLGDMVNVVTGAFLGFGTIDIDASLSWLANSIIALITSISRFFGITSWKLVTFQFNLRKAIIGLADVLQHPEKAIINLGKTFINFITTIPARLLKALSLVGNGFVELGKNILNVLGKLFGFDSSKVIKKIESIAAEVSSFFMKGGQKLQSAFSVICSDIFGEFPKAFSEMISDFQAGTVPEKIETVLSFIGGAIKRGVGTIISAVGALIGVDLSDFKGKVLGFLDAFTDQLAKLNPGWEGVWDTICKIFWGLVDIFKGLADAIFWIIGEVTGIENMGPDKILDLIGWILEKFVTVIVFLANGLGTVIEAIGPTILGTLSFLKDIFKQLWSALMYLIGVDKSPEALKALENVRSVIKTVILIFAAATVLKFFRAMRWMMEGFADLADTFSGRSFGGILRSVTNMVRNIALVLLAIGILANQDIGGLAMAVTAFGVVMAIITSGMKRIMKEMTNLAKAMQKKSISDKAMAKAVGSVSKILGKLALMSIVFTIALGILAKMTKKYGPDNMGIAVAALGSMLAILLTGTALIIKVSSKLSSSDKKLNKVIQMIAKVSIAITIMSLALNRVIKQITQSIVETGDDTAVLDAMMIMCYSIMALVVGTSIIMIVGNKVDTKKLGKISGTVAVAALVLGSIALIITLLAQSIDTQNQETLPEKAIMALVFSVILVAAAIIAMKVAVKDNLPKQASKVGDILVRSLSGITKIAVTTQAVLAMVAGLLGTFLLISLVIDKMNLSQILKSFVIAVGFFFASAVMVKMMGSIKIETDWKNMLAYAASMLGIAFAFLILSKAVGLLSIAVIALEKTDGVKTLFLALAILGGIMVAVGIVGAFAKNSSGLLSLSVAILSIAGALMIFALALALLSLIPGDKVGQLAMDIAKAFVVLLVGLMAIIAVSSLLKASAKLIDAIGRAVMKFAIAVGILVLVILALAIVDDLAGKLTDALYDLNAKLPELIEALVTVVVTLINALADSLLDHAEEIGEGLFKLLLAIVGIVVELLSRVWENGLKPILELAGEWWGEVLGKVWNGIKSIAKAVGGFIVSVNDAIVGFFKAIWDAIVSFFEFLLSIPGWLFDLGVSLLNGLWDGIKSVAATIGNFIKDLFVGFWNTICAVFDTVTDFFADVLQNAWKGLKKGFSAVSTFITNLFKTLWNLITAPFKAAWELGKNIVEGLWNGISDAVEWLKKKISGFCESALGAIKDFFGISSPSKVMGEIGGFLMEGLGNGISSGEGGVLDTIGGVVSDVVGGFLPLDNIPVGFNTDDLTSQAMNGISGLDVGANIDYSQLQAFDGSQYGLDSVYTVGALADYSAIGSATIPANIAPTIEDAQLEQISDVNVQNTEEIVSALGEVKDELSKQAEIISKFSIILDTGTLVGELRDPMDKALGNKSRLATGRGI